MHIKMVVVGTNSNGAADFFPCTVNIAQRYYLEGEHYILAQVEANKYGFAGDTIPCDENDPLFKPFANSVKWDEVRCLTNKD